MFILNWQLNFTIMKKLLMLFAITIFAISISSNTAFAQKGRGNGNGKMKQVDMGKRENMDNRTVILNRPVRRIYTTPANRYGRRPIGVRHDNGKHKGWYKGKAKRRVLR